MSSHKARVFRHRAEEFRELALSMGPGERQAMLLTADDYERIAALVDNHGQPAEWSSNDRMFISPTGDDAAAADRSA
jgi:hypothetical protein